MSVIQFDRVGRNHNVAPLTLADDLTDDAVAEAVFRYVLPKLGSADVSVAVDIDDHTRAIDGQIFCGFRDGGTFRSVAS